MAPTSVSYGMLERPASFIASYPYASGLAAIAIVCIATRLITGVQCYLQSQRNARSDVKIPEAVPYWIPWLGHAISFAVGFQSYIGKLNSQTDKGIFALTIGGTKHNMITAPSLARLIVSPGKNTPASMEGFIYHIMKMVWNDHGAIKNMDYNVLWDDVHSVLYGLMREPFLSDSIAKTTDHVERRTWNLISGNASIVDQSFWEKKGHVDVITPGEDFVAEADMWHLLRDFVGDIATTVLYGREFLEHNPEILTDLWELDSKFNEFLLGLPSVFPGMASPSRARERIVEAVREHHEACMKVLDGQDPGTKYENSEACSIIWERVAAFKKANVEPRAYATGDAAILWAMNVNANQVIFWLIWYLYRDRTLLKEIRQEIEPFVTFRKPENPAVNRIHEAPRLQINMRALMNECPLLKGAFYETMRLEAGSTSYKEIKGDMIVEETDEEAQLQGRSKGGKYLLKKGEYACVPHGVHHIDPLYFRNPEQFDARRFWVNGKDEKGSESTHVDYGNMKVWGGGKTLCKGKNFAEREVLLFAAAIVTAWEMEPVGGSWTFPGRLTAAGTYKPKKDPRVKVFRRRDLQLKS